MTGCFLFLSWECKFNNTSVVCLFSKDCLTAHYDYQLMFHNRAVILLSSALECLVLSRFLNVYFSFRSLDKTDLDLLFTKEALRLKNYKNLLFLLCSAHSITLYLKIYAIVPPFPFWWKCENALSLWGIFPKWSLFTQPMWMVDCSQVVNSIILWFGAVRKCLQETCSSYLHSLFFLCHFMQTCICIANVLWLFWHWNWKPLRTQS